MNKPDRNLERRVPAAAWLAPTTPNHTIGIDFTCIGELPTTKRGRFLQKLSFQPPRADIAS